MLGENAAKALVKQPNSGAGDGEAGNFPQSLIGGCAVPAQGENPCCGDEGDLRGLDPKVGAEEGFEKFLSRFQPSSECPGEAKTVDHPEAKYEGETMFCW